MKGSKTYFCTFADSRFQPTLKRIESEARSSGFFDDVFIFNEFNLNKDLKKKFGSILKYRVKGFGFWIWKVFIIQDVLSKIKEGDILLYTDSGCSINKKGYHKFLDYIRLVNESELGILAVSLEDNFLESKYTKGDLFDYLGVRNNSTIYNTPQIQAGVLLIRKNDNSAVFFKKWQKVYEEDISLVNDDPSKHSNFPEFIAHRHDQSVFSILFKLNNQGVTIPLSDVWVKKLEDLELLNSNPILVLRKKNKKIFGLIYLFINWLKDFVAKKRIFLTNYTLFHLS